MQTIYKKIDAIRKELGILKKDAKNPHFKNTYIQFPTLQEKLSPLLEKYGLVLSQPLRGTGISTILVDLESGEKLEFDSTIHAPEAKPQDQMSGVTYMKRYAIVGLFNLEVGDEDDDGNKASSKRQTKEDLEDINFD